MSRRRKKVNVDLLAEFCTSIIMGLFFFYICLYVILSGR